MSKFSNLIVKTANRMAQSGVNNIRKYGRASISEALDGLQGAGAGQEALQRAEDIKRGLALLDEALRLIEGTQAVQSKANDGIVAEAQSAE